MKNDHSQVQAAQGQTHDPRYGFAGQARGDIAPVLGHTAVVIPVFLPVVALVIWLGALRGANPKNISDFGLITALPPAALFALLLLVISFSIAIMRRELPVPVLMLHILILIFMLYGAALLVEDLPRTAIAWKLSGIMDYVLRHGAVDPARDAFQNWPGFYFLVAFLTAAAGGESPLALAAWAHVLANLLYLGPLILLFRSATADNRLIWLGIWFFYLNNWIGQDYLAPQAFGYLLYLVTLGILLNWFQTRGGLSGEWVARFKIKTRLGAPPPELVEARAGERDGSRGDVGGPAGTAKQLVGLTAIVLLFLLVLVPSHQLTPIALLVSLAALVVFKRIVPRGLPLFLAVLIVAWIGYMAVPFVIGHADVFTEPFGALTSNVADNLTKRLRGSPEHMFAVRLRIYMTLSVCIFAALGFIRRLRAGSRDFNFALLLLVPFSLLALQTYGGELLLRSYLFALPFVAFFMAALFLPRLGVWSSPSWTLSSLIMTTLSAMLVLGFFVSRYGNERMDYFRPDEVEAVDYVYSIAQPGAQLVAVTDFLPWRFKEYNTYTYSTATGIARRTDITGLVERMSDRKYPQSYLILTRSQGASMELLFGWEAKTWEGFETALVASGKFELIYENAEARVYALVSP